MAGPSASRSIRVELPWFGGKDPTEWLFKVYQFFIYHHTPESQKITLVAFYMDDPASQWFQWMRHSWQLRSWQEFKVALKFRFGPSAYKDAQGTLTKSMQTKTVIEYQTRFEELPNKVFSLSEQFLKSCFIYGLKSGDRRKVVAH
ncbi:hypothetical protein NE237_020182 [Protea cynaroides]|uniref:Retrotransposon gag domain-containing protein n=1 Tax=Protea cynaroides TaxID=273540 RepID=A0A9Q0K2C9_9MAGN|nr:hypothetical protein NE237_020182 [Protea cynaroides]